MHFCSVLTEFQFSVLDLARERRLRETELLLWVAFGNEDLSLGYHIMW